MLYAVNKQQSLLLSIILPLSILTSACVPGDGSGLTSGPCPEPDPDTGERVLTGAQACSGTSHERQTLTFLAKGLDSSKYYDITLTGMTADADLHVAGTFGLNNEYEADESVTVGGYEEYEITVENMSSKYVTIGDGSLSTPFTLTIKENIDLGTIPLSEGTNESPIDISGELPYTGYVSFNKSSYYHVTGLEANVFYEVTLTDPPSGTDVSDASSWSVAVVSDNDYSTFDTEGGLCKISDYTTTICAFQMPANGEIYLRVSSFSNINFVLDLLPSNSPEGTVDQPVVWDYTSSATNIAKVAAEYPADDGVIYGAVPSYYQITGLTPGQAYTVSFEPGADNFYLGFSIKEKSGTLVHESDFRITSTYSVGNITAPADGTLILEIYSKERFGDDISVSISEFVP